MTTGRSRWKRIALHPLIHPSPMPHRACGLLHISYVYRAVASKRMLDKGNRLRVVSASQLASTHIGTDCEGGVCPERPAVQTVFV